MSIALENDARAAEERLQQPGTGVKLGYGGGVTSKKGGIGHTHFAANLSVYCPPNRVVRRSGAPPNCSIVFRAGGRDSAAVMTRVTSDSLVVFQLGEQQFALGVTAVERVVQAVEIATLPDEPRGVRGVINLQGRIVPVFDLWSRLGQPVRDE